MGVRERIVGWAVSVGAFAGAGGAIGCEVGGIMAQFVIASKYIVNPDHIAFMSKSDDGSLVLTFSGVSNKDGGNRIIILKKEEVPAFLESINVKDDEVVEDQNKPLRKSDFLSELRP